MYLKWILNNFPLPSYLMIYFQNISERFLVLVFIVNCESGAFYQLFLGCCSQSRVLNPLSHGCYSQIDISNHIFFPKRYRNIKKYILMIYLYSSFIRELSIESKEISYIIKLILQGKLIFLNSIVQI